MNELIANKIDELVALCKVEDEMAIASILLSVRGSMLIGVQDVLCSNVSQFTRDVLIPMCEQGKADQHAVKN